MTISKKIKSELKKLGKHIRKLRKEKGISIEELSEKTNIRKEYLKKIESGTAYGVMFENHLVKIAKITEVTLSELFDYE